MTSRSLTALGLLAVSLAGCAPRPAADARSEPAPVVSAPNPADAPLGEDAVLLVARVNSPAQSAERLRQVAREDVDLAPLLPWPALAGIVDRAAPVDFVVALELEPQSRALATRTVLAFSASDAAAAETTLRALGLSGQRGADGLLELSGTGALPTCALPASRLQSRIVCGRTLRDVRALGAYVRGELSRKKLGDADLQAELRVAAVRARFAGHMSDLGGQLANAALDIQSRNPKFDRAVAALLRTASGELTALVNDVERADLEARFDPASASLDAKLELEFRASTSRLVSLLRGQSASAGPAPDSFWQLPGDARAAAFVRGLDPEWISSQQARFGSLFGDALSYQGTPPKLRDDAVELVAGLPPPRGVLAWSSGAAPFDRRGLDRLDLAQRDLALNRARVGYRVLAVEEPPDRYVSYLVKLASAFEDPVLGPQLRRFITAQGGEAPLHVRVRAPSGGTGLPSGSRVAEIGYAARELDPRTGNLISGRKAGLTLFCVVIAGPAGQGTLLGLAADERLVSGKLRMARESRSARGQLRQRNDLERLQQGGLVAGGFWSAASLWASPEAQLDPDGERTPALYWASAGPSSFALQMRVPAASVAEHVAAWRARAGAPE